MRQTNPSLLPACFRTVAFTSTLLLSAFSLHAQSTPPTASQYPSKTFTDTLKADFERGEFEAKPAPAMRWLDNGNRYTVLEPSASGTSELIAYDTNTGQRTVLVSASQLTPAGAAKPLTIDDYFWSPDGKSLLIFTNAQKVWRLRTRGDYWTLSLADGKLSKLGGDGPAATMMFGKFSPDSTSVAYVRNNNIFVQALASGNIRQLTTDGSPDIINGTTDWVTEEELSLRDAFRWSPDSKSIAYWQFDQSGVGEFSLINDTKEQYPVVFRYKYPQPGGVNASVRAGVISAQGGATTWIKLPGDPRNNYIPRLDWVGDSNQIVLQYLNRLQNTNQVYTVDAATGQAHMLFEDKDKAWVDIMDKFEWVAKPGQHRQDMLWISERDGWRHAYLASRQTGQLRLITNFPGDIITPLSIDSANGFFYFIASPTDPIRAYLYRAPLDGSKAPERLTPVNESGRHTYDVSPNGAWAIHSFSSAAHPPSYEIVQLPSHKVARVLVNNDGLVAKDKAIDPQPVEFLETPVSGGVKLSTFMIKPPNFDPSKKYPVLVYIYSEPAATTVQDRWAYTLNKAMAREGYIIVSFDNQGTPAPRGREWRKGVYGAVGVLSSKQQDEAIREFARQHSFVDTTRMGIFGHSGGGSATLNMMFRHPGLFQAGISMAPVPDQLLYDSIYQEKYMGLPADNPQGYRDGSPISFAEGLEGHLLIMHGSGDDNVHFQGTERLVNRLIALDKPFDFMDYPNRTHALSEGEGTLVHRYTLLMRYFEQYVPPGPR